MSNNGTQAQVVIICVLTDGLLGILAERMDTITVYGMIAFAEKFPPREQAGGLQEEQEGVPVATKVTISRHEDEEPQVKIEGIKPIDLIRYSGILQLGRDAWRKMNANREIITSIVRPERELPPGLRR